jgi:Asp-tRNA(Asn)/Glu-tRNA(Gln) amidotransferase A subunit family amidase
MKDATALLADLKSGTITPRQAVAEAIAKTESSHTRLNAAIEILKTEATAQLENLPAGALHGLPISVKECYAMAGRQIRSGSTRMKPIQCSEDATVVKRLKAAGAVIVARGNTSEFLLGRETDNLIYGTTNSAINPELTAGGSSGGDGSLTAGGCVAFGIGTDIGGSVRYPAAFNGIIGFKPASGMIDKTGIFPEAGVSFTETMNSPGILCRSVRDARMIYQVIADKPLAVQNAVADKQVYTSSRFRVAVKDDSITTALDAAGNFFRESSFSVRDLEIPESGRLYILFAILMCAGFTDNIYEWSTSADGRKLSFIGELIRRNRGKKTISDELFGMLLPFNLLKPGASKLKKTIDEVTALREKYYASLDNHILLLPTLGILAPRHKKFVPQYNKPGVIEIITPVSCCNVLNLSCITIPAWNYQKAPGVNPPAIQLACAPGNEALLLNAAEQLEAALNSKIAKSDTQTANAEL